MFDDGAEGVQGQCVAASKLAFLALSFHYHYLCFALVEFNIATCFDLMGNFLQDCDGTVVVLSGKLEYLLFRWNSIRDWTKVSSQDADFQVNQVNSTWVMHEAF